ncbi:MAG: hypothetical protein OXE05_01415 [Chloroflexi bacterium]|nr:hypothetical protein [Chloroflexota bacterium]
MSTASTGTATSAALAEARIRETRYTQGEVVALARLILRDSRLNVVAGSDWAYIARGHTLTFPTRVLNTWAGTSIVGAICQQMGEAQHTGVMGERALQSFARIAPLAFTAVMPFARFVNELRVNRMHLERHPGSARFLRALYADNPHWSSARRRSTPLREQVQQGLLERWLQEEWPEGVRPMRIGSTANRYVDVLWPGVRDALRRDSLPQMLDVLARRMLPILHDLVEEDARLSQDRPDQERPFPEEEGGAEEDGAEGLGELNIEASSDDVESTERQPDESELQDRTRTPSDSEPVAVSGEDGGPAKIESSPDEQAELRQDGDTSARQRQQPQGPPQLIDPRMFQARPGGLNPLPRTLVQGLGERPAAPKTDYENFDYRAAVRRLEAAILRSLNGEAGRKGLREIMMRRRFGSLEPGRRPRRRRGGDSGDIDSDHIERLVVAPEQAFLKGVRAPRADHQKDFAATILIDVSGSMVAKGYSTRKFDHTVDAAVIFAEIHERLRIPFQMMAFSEEVWRLRTFDECVFATQVVANERTYTPKDLSNVFRTMYEQPHKKTDDAGALRQAVQDMQQQKGFKTILVLTDGISSNRRKLRDVLFQVERRNGMVGSGDALGIIVFGIGVPGNALNESYVIQADDRFLRCLQTVVVPDVARLPRMIQTTIERRIRGV